MNEIQLSLTRLIGKKELTFGCLVTIESSKGQKRTAQIVDYNEKGFATFVSNGNIMTLTPNNRAKSQWKIVEIINHHATLSDFHRFINERQKKNKFTWEQRDEEILYDCYYEEYDGRLVDYQKIPYDSSKDLLDQESDTLKQIVELIKSNK